MSNIKATVLVVEDEQYILKVLETLLSADGYRVITAQNGAVARSQAFSHMPDVVLLDLGLPDTDGIRLLRELREQINLPVIVVSARNMEQDKVAALDNGADDYITKPFSAPELLARIRAVLRRRSTVAEGPSDMYTVGGFSIDFDKRVVTVDGEPVSLTPIEYSILHLLMKNPGKVYSTKALYEEVWQETAFGSEGAVAVHIRHLREKIEINPSEPRYIKVVWGQGYKLEGGKR